MHRKFIDPLLYLLASEATVSAVSGTLSSAAAPPTFPRGACFCASSLSRARCPWFSGRWGSTVLPLAWPPTPSTPPEPGFFLWDWPSWWSSALLWPWMGFPRPVCTSADVAPPMVSEAAGGFASASAFPGGRSWSFWGSNVLKEG